MASFSKRPRYWFTATRVYIEIVVVVNATIFLWITLVYTAKSWAWRFYKPVNDSVHRRCSFWTNFAAVDNATLVHNRYLWICRTLSTGSDFSCLKPLFGRCDAIDGCRSVGDRFFFLRSGFCSARSNQQTREQVYS